MDKSNEILEQLQGDFNGSEYSAIVGTTVSAQPIVQKNAIRKGVIITADPDNAGITYIGFTRNVSAANFFFFLRAGDWFSIDDFRGEIYAVADTASQGLGIGEY